MKEPMKKEQVPASPVSRSMLSASSYRVEAELDRLWEHQHQHQQKYDRSLSGTAESKEIPS